MAFTKYKVTEVIKKQITMMDAIERNNTVLIRLVTLNNKNKAKIYNVKQKAS